MRFVRPASLVLLAMFAASGCRTAGVDQITQRSPVPPKSGVDTNQIIADHNRNAERIQSLEARPTIQVTANGKNYRVDGMLALERRRNFRLQIQSTFSEVADIGSNDEHFWFWIKDSTDRAVYYCNYDESGSTPLVATLQPDWIVEALGLRIIPNNEAKDIKVTRGDQPGTLVLTYQPTRTGGETVIRKTVISETTHQIQEHQLYSEKMALLARATVNGYQPFPASSKTGEKETVLVPKRVKLEWRRERLAMDVTLQPTAINVPFNARRTALFTEEPRKGYARINLAEVGKASEPSSPRGRTSIRETRPAPPTGGVELGDPTPMDTDGALRTSDDPVVLSADLPAIPSLKDTLVGAPRIFGPEPQYTDPGSNAGWRRPAQPSVEY